MANWHAESIRLTTFHKDVIDVKKVEWWKETFGHDSEIAEVKAGNHSRTESGVFGNGRLFLAINGNKVDWQLASPVEVTWTEDGIGSLEEAYKGVAEFWSKWLLSREDVIRLAFGAVAFVSVPGRKEGYQALQSFLPNLNLDPENSRDLSYRINRPRTMDIDGEPVTINRVMSWSVRKLTTFSLHVLGNPRAVDPSGEIFRAVCEVDVNTDAERSQLLPSGELVRILEALKDMGAEVVERGDIA